ncbi:transcription termination/antitermination protein NusG [Mesorhizobium australicum]|uniref:transcription termination/antitermination protein NusG n=1 Tax=Mesorhizobium australicum TaxID=536018 RepID=UPI001592C47D|nr:transcription termination/antitermination NusG family protein [Mesorhizobium australicum]
MSHQPGREDIAEANLLRQGFKPFVARQLFTVRHARRLTVRRGSFFPGYMFVRLDLTRDRWRSVNGTMGVRSIVMIGERPAPCPAGLVEQLIDMTNADGILDFSSKLRVGDAVRVVSGPFANLIGRLDRLDGPGRARVLLSIMNGEVAATIAAKDLAAA